METPKEYYEKLRKHGWTTPITENPNPDYNLPFYQTIFKLMEGYAKLHPQIIPSSIFDVNSLSANQKAIEYAKLKHSEEYNDKTFERDISETEIDFARGFIACSEYLKSINSNEPDQPKTDSTNKVMKEVCGDEINPYLLNGSELKKAEDFKKRY